MSQKLKVESEVPNWTKWIAVNPSGSCHAFSKKPKHHNIGTFWVTTNTSKQKLLYNGPAPKNWKNELYTWE